MTNTTAIALATNYEKLQQLVETGEFSPEDIADTLAGIEGVFPVCTGMNRLTVAFISFAVRVPRMHGDEPSPATPSGKSLLCSPYARG